MEKTEIVKILRGEMSQAKFAEITGLKQQAIANYELGRIPKPDVLSKIAAAVGKKVEWVIMDIEKEKNDKAEI